MKKKQIDAKINTVNIYMKISRCLSLICVDTDQFSSLLYLYTHNYEYSANLYVPKEIYNMIWIKEINIENWVISIKIKQLQNLQFINNLISPLQGKICQSSILILDILVNMRIKDIYYGYFLENQELSIYYGNIYESNFFPGAYYFYKKN